MKCKLSAALLKIGGMAFFLFVSLFAGGSWQSSADFVRSVLGGISVVLRDVETQWMVFLILVIYSAAFFFYNLHSENKFARKRNKNKTVGWLIYVLIVSAALYAIHYAASTLALTLLAGSAFGQGAVFWAALEGRRQKAEAKFNFNTLVVLIFMVFLATASIWHADFNQFGVYGNFTRWTGPWDDPNMAGLFMGVGTSLAMGMVLREWWIMDGRSKNTVISLKIIFQKYAFMSAYLVAAMLMGRGLLHSYSRGAWLGTGCGLMYLIYLSTRQQRRGEASASVPAISCISWIKNSGTPFFVMSVSVVILVFWHCRQTSVHPIHRAMSAVNPVDFSWRNRVEAWEGDLQIAAEHPWFGMGWNQPEPLYEHYYLPPKLTESVAIQMNDYLLIGATLGVPALFCFGMYLWSSLGAKSKIGIQKLQISEIEWTRATCRAGAIVLLVGFWFDGGLFKLATASTFWILLELGIMQNCEPREICENG